MNTRVSFLRWKPLDWIAILFLVMVVATIFTAIYYGTWEPVGILVVVFFGMLMMAIVNRTNDRVEKAKDSRSPPGPDEVLSFSLEKEIEEEKNK